MARLLLFCRDLLEEVVILYRRLMFTLHPGLVAIHPVAEALKDEYSYVAWRLGHEAFLRFNYDPDDVFSEKIEQHGFRE